MFNLNLAAISGYIADVFNAREVIVGDKKARWIKVKDLKVGIKIAVTGTWDKDAGDRSQKAGNNATGTGTIDFDEILTIKKVGREQVYDIEVEGSRNFVGNGILAHNTYINGTVNATDFTCSNCLNAGDIAADAVDTSEIAAGAVHQAELDTTTTTVSGTSDDQVTLNDYTFFPNFDRDDCSSSNWYIKFTTVDQTNNTVGRIRLGDPSAGYCATGSWDVWWRYVTASDHPTIWLITNPDSTIKTVWQSEDPVVPAEYPNNPNPFEGTTLSAGQQFASVDTLTVDQLNSLYTSLPQSDRQTILSDLKSYIVTKRGWLADFAAIANINAIAERYQPTARLWAMRFVAEHYGISPSELILELMLYQNNRLELKTNFYPELTAHLRQRAENLARQKTEEASLASLPTDQQQADLAEWYTAFKDEAGNLPQPGDLLSIVPVGQSSTVGRSRRDYDPKLLGVVSTSPKEVMGIKQNDNDVKIALAGRVPVKVSSINGPISAGDPITSSGIPGVGMKATKPGQIIGKALAGYANSDPNAVGTILVLINLSWYDPDAYLTDTGELSIITQGEPELLTANSVNRYRLTDVTGAIVQRVGAFSKLITATLETGYITTKDLIAENIIRSPKVETNIISSNGTNLTIDLGALQEQGDALQAQSGFGKLLVKGNMEVAGDLTANNAKFSGNVGIGTADSQSLITDNPILTVNGNTDINGKLEVNEITGTSARFKKIQAETIDGLEGIFEKLSTGWLKTQNISGIEQQVLPTPTGTPQGDTLQAQFTQPEAGQGVTLTDPVVATDSASLIALAESWPVVDPSNDVVLKDSIKIQNNLSVTGITILAQTIVAGPFSQDGTLIIDNGNSINVLAGTLYIQNNGMGGGIDLLAGKVTINPNGDATFEGDLTVKGTLFAGLISNNGKDIVIGLGGNPTETQQGDTLGTQGVTLPDLLVKGNNGEIVFSLNASGSGEFKGDLASSGLKIVRDAIASEPDFSGTFVSTASAGLAYIPAGRKEVGIKTDKIKENSLIYLTPVGSSEGLVPYLARIKPEENTFFIGIDRLTTNDIKFSWWVIN